MRSRTAGDRIEWVREASEFPRPCTLADYESAILEYVEPLTRRSEIAGIYQFGSVGAPGISDIDLIVVLEDDVHTFPEELLRLDRLSATARYLFMHRPFVMGRSACRGIRLFYDVHRLTARHGRETPESLVGDRLPTGMEERDVRTAMLVDFGMELLRQFVQKQVSGRVEVRPLLCLLLSAQTSINLAAGLGILDLPRSQAFGERIRTLRADAFALPAPVVTAGVARLVESAADLLSTALFRAGERLGGPEAAGGILEFGPKDLVVFTRKVTSENVLALSLHDSHDTDRRWSWHRIKNRMVLFQAAGLMAHFGCYAAGDGPVARAVATRLMGSGGEAVLPPSYARVLSAKLEYAERQAEFLARIGLSFGQMFLYTLGPANTGADRSWLSELMEGWMRRTYRAYAE